MHKLRKYIREAIAGILTEKRTRVIDKKIWDKELGLRKTFGKEFDDNFAKRVEILLNAVKNQDKAEKWAMYDFLKLPAAVGTLKITESVNESDNWKTVKDKSGDTLKPGKKYTMDGYDGEITFIRFDRDNKTLHLKSNKMGKIRTSIDNVKDMKLVESVNEAFKKGDLVMYDGKGLHGRKSGTRGKVIKIGGGKATMKYGKAKDQVEVVPIKALRNPLTQQHFKSSTEMKKFSNDLNESFSDGSPESQERIKKYSEVLGYSLVGELDEPSFKLREAKLLRFFNEFIAKQGEKWVVKSKAGKTLGTHATKDEAIKQLAAVEISKKKN